MIDLQNSFKYSINFLIIFARSGKFFDQNYILFKYYSCLHDKIVLKYTFITVEYNLIGLD